MAHAYIEIVVCETSAAYVGKGEIAVAMASAHVEFEIGDVIIWHSYCHCPRSAACVYQLSLLGAH